MIKSNFSNLMIRRFSPESIEYNFEQYHFTGDSFNVKFKVSTPEILRLYNSPFFVKPGDEIHLQIEGNYPTIKVGGFNNEFIRIMESFEKIDTNIFLNPNNFKTSSYVELVDSFETMVLDSLGIYYHNYFGSGDEQEKLFKSYISSYSLFLYSLPFNIKSISTAQLDELSKIVMKKIISFQKFGYDNRYEDFDVAIENFFINGIFKKQGSFSSILTLSEWKDFEDILKKIIASKFIGAYYNNEIQLTTDDIDRIQEILCKDDDVFENRFCDYYKVKVQYQNLDLSSLSSKDTLTDANGKKFSLSYFLAKDSIHIYFWASWCGPCIQFLSQLDQKKIHNPKFSNILFISVDDSFKAWLNRNNMLKLPLANSFVIKKGLQSNFAKGVSIDHVPFITDIENNKIVKLNVAKNVLSNFLKE